MKMRLLHFLIMIKTKRGTLKSPLEYREKTYQFCIETLKN